MQKQGAGRTFIHFLAGVAPLNEVIGGIATHADPIYFSTRR